MRQVKSISDNQNIRINQLLVYNDSYNIYKLITGKRPARIAYPIFIIQF